jgi:hypothetical protein
LNGAINIMQRPDAGNVNLNAGHKVFDLETGTPFVLSGPDRAEGRGFRSSGGAITGQRTHETPFV